MSSAGPAVLLLEDGRSFEGRGFGAEGQHLGEVVFNTSMTGYQEVLTDPSYAGQIVVMTQPQIGNYGTNQEDVESRRSFVSGFVVRECSPVHSNWRAEAGLDEYLKGQGVIGISDIDTRAVVRHIRRHGAMRGILSRSDCDPESLLEKVLSHPPMLGSDYVTQVSTDSDYVYPTGEERFHVAAFDFGIKTNILRMLAARGCRTTVVPAATSAEDVLALKPDGIFLSNGPGDPEPLEDVVSTIRRLIGRRPIFGICLGHQLLGLSLGGKSFKLKFGHRGANQPVKNVLSGRVEITSQNHGFAIDADSLAGDQIELTHFNLNDQTLEGLRHRQQPVFSVQYHPEASPGPHDSHYLFDEFLDLMAGGTGWSDDAERRDG